jgi:hypothetical protein
MGIFSGIVNYQNFEVESGITSNFFISPTISANTISGGALSALYVASGKVTNQEFKYLSGTTSNIQIQLNSLSNIGEPFLTFSSSTSLTNEKILIEGPGLSLDEFGDKLVINTSLTSTEFVWINFDMTDPSYTAITNWNPFEFDTGFKATSIRITGLEANAYPSIISGLTGGTNGRIVFITNITPNFPIIFENNSTKCPYSCRFTFSMGEAFFLSSRGTLSLIYDGDSQSWKELYPVSRESMFDFYDDFNYRSTNTYGSSNYGNGLAGRVYSGGGVYGLTGFGDSSSVIFFKGTAAPGFGVINGYSSSFCPGRQSIYNFRSFFVAKVSVDGLYSGGLNYNQCVSVSNVGYVRNYSQVCAGSFSSASHWLTSGNSWVNVNGPATSVFQTDLQINDTIFNFVFLGICCNGVKTGFFYSTDGNEYKFSNITTYQNQTNGAFGMGARVTGTTTPQPTLFCDWYGLKLQ